MPVLFYYYGARLREKSTFAPTCVPPCSGFHKAFWFADFRMHRFSSANQDSHNSEGGTEDDEMVKADVQLAEMSEKAKL